MKKTIITAAVTTLVVNFLLSSTLFWILAFVALWVYMGYLFFVIEDDDDFDFVGAWVFPPMFIIIALVEHRMDGIDNLWNHWFSRDFPRFSFRSPISFKDED